MESETSPQEKLNQIRALLYPECLEQFSKVITILTEELSFKIESLYQLKETQKIVKSKEELASLIIKLSEEPHNIITLNESKDEAKINLTKEYMLYSFVNIPITYSKDNVIDFLKLKEGDFSRLYKQSLFWILVSENAEFNEGFGKFYKTLNVEDKQLKCNATSSMMLKNAIIKMIQHNNYVKETGGLSTGNEVGGRRKSSGGSGGYKNSFNDNNQHKTSTEMSWRKKSDDEVPKNEHKDSGNNKYHKNSNDYYNNDGYYYGKNDYKDTYYGKGDYYGGGYGYKDNKDYGNYGYGGGKKNRRQRFKSDPTEDYYGYNNEEEKIDMSKVKYPGKIKYKYSNKEIVDFYMKIKESIKLDKSFFKNYIEDIMLSEQPKTMSIISKENFANEIPKNNPLLNFRVNK